MPCSLHTGFCEASFRDDGEGGWEQAGSLSGQRSVWEPQPAEKSAPEQFPKLCGVFSLQSGW